MEKVCIFISFININIAIPEGDTTYVLRKDNLYNIIEIWNPITGEAFGY